MAGSFEATYDEDSSVAPRETLLKPFEISEVQPGSKALSMGGHGEANEWKP